jgi:hypothetical protein
MRSIHCLMTVLALAACDGTIMGGTPPIGDDDDDSVPSADAASDPIDAMLPPDPDADTGPPPYGIQRPVPIDDTESFGETPPRGYMEYLPGRYDASSDRRWPLIIALHGIGECGDGSLEALRLLPRPGVGLAGIIAAGTFVAHDRFIVLSPQDANTSQYMNPAKTAAFLELAKAHYKIDESRMYLTGLSFGGRSAWDYVNVYGTESQFAAVVTVPGDGSYDTFDCAKAGQTPHWAFQGAMDSNFLTSLVHVRTSIAAINDCATPPIEPARLTVYPDLGHFVWGPTYGLSGMNRTFDLSDPLYSPYDVDIYTWFLQHTR